MKPGRPSRGAVGSVSRLLLLALAIFVATASEAFAVPAFGVQTGQTCNACHVGGFGPQLTPFGREFKMGGYTLRTNSFNIPLSTMVVASYLRTQKDQESPPANHYSVNDNATLDQVGLFFAGGFASHLGAFVQGTYDGVARSFHWDNLDLRAVTTAKIGKTDLVLGASVNNAPTVQDAFNTLPSWGFPYTGSALSPSPAAAPLIGRLAQNTVGVTAYAWINSELYLEAGGYRSPSRYFLNGAGVDPFDPGSINGVAPYARVAYQKNFGLWNYEVGVFGMSADVLPGRDHTTGKSDHYRDVGLDGSFQYFAKGKDIYTLNARFTDERQTLDASQVLGLSLNRQNSLTDVRFDASYYLRGKTGFTVGAFNTNGTRDDVLYGSNRSLRPNTTGMNFQIDHTFFGAGGSPFGNRANLRIGAQYTTYFEFDGADRNYDGFGRNAADNDTLRLFLWAAY